VIVDANFAFLEDRLDDNTAFVPVKDAVVSVSPLAPTTSLRLEVMPTPAAPGSAITFAFTALGSERAQVQIYDVAGRLVAAALDGHVSAGRRTVIWNRRDREGAFVHAGVYF